MRITLSTEHYAQIRGPSGMERGAPLTNLHYSVTIKRLPIAPTHATNKKADTERYERRCVRTFFDRMADVILSIHRAVADLLPHSRMAILAVAVAVIGRSLGRSSSPVLWWMVDRLRPCGAKPCSPEPWSHTDPTNESLAGWPGSPGRPRLASSCDGGTAQPIGKLRIRAATFLCRVQCVTP